MAANQELDFEEILDRLMGLDIQNIDQLPPQDDNLEEVNDDDGVVGDVDDDVDDDEDEGCGPELLPLELRIRKDIAAGTAQENEDRIYCSLDSYVLVNTAVGVSILCLQCYHHYRYKILPTWKHTHTHRHNSGFMSELARSRCSGCKKYMTLYQLQETCYYCLTNKLI